MDPGCRDFNFTPRQSRSNLISVPPCPNLSKSGQFPDFLDFWDPETPNIFRRFRSPVAAPAELLPGKCPYFVQLFLGFHQNLSKMLIFISQSPPFYENPVSSVRPSEAKTGRVHPHSGGVVGFSIIGFSSMTPPDDGGDGGGDGGDGEVETKSPRGNPVHHSHPGAKISRSGVPHSDILLGKDTG